MARIGTLVNQLQRIRKQKEEAQAVVKKAELKVKSIAERYNKKEQELYHAMKAQGVEIGDVEEYKAKIKTTTHATVKDWPKFYGYVKRNNAWDMLQKRVNDGAYRERLDNGKNVPGVEPFSKISISLTKK
mgnify:CR=1 FL=1